MEQSPTATRSNPRRQRWQIAILALAVSAAVLIQGCQHHAAAPTTWPPAAAFVTFRTPPLPPAGGGLPQGAILLAGLHPGQVQQTRPEVWRQPVLYLDPVPSPDGSLLTAAGLAANDANSRGDCRVLLYFMRRDGSWARRLTAGHPFTFDHAPAWAPNGRAVAYQSDVYQPLEGNKQLLNPVSSSIWVTTLVGGNPRRLCEGGSPSWSPHGDQLLVTSRSGISTVDLSGRAKSLIPLPVSEELRWLLGTGLPVPAMLSAAWSPDGRHIAYTAPQLNAQHHPSGVISIWVANPDGSHPVCLTPHPAAPPDSFSWPVQDLGPRWAPDGLSLCFTRLQHVNSLRAGDRAFLHTGAAVYQLSTDGKHTRRLSPNGQFSYTAISSNAILLQYAVAGLPGA